MKDLQVRSVVGCKMMTFLTTEAMQETPPTQKTMQRRNFFFTGNCKRQTTMIGTHRSAKSVII